MLLSLVVGACVLSLFCTVVPGVLSSVAIISLRKRELVVLPNLPSYCHVAVSIVCLLLVVPWVGLQCVIVAFPGHTRLLFLINFQR